MSKGAASVALGWSIMEYACDEIKFCSQQLLAPGPSGLGVAARGGKCRTRWDKAVPNGEHSAISQAFYRGRRGSLHREPAFHRLARLTSATKSAKSSGPLSSTTFPRLLLVHSPARRMPGREIGTIIRICRSPPAALARGFRHCAYPLRVRSAIVAVLADDLRRARHVVRHAAAMPNLLSRGKEKRTMRAIQARSEFPNHKSVKTKRTSRQKSTIERNQSCQT